MTHAEWLDLRRKGIGGSDLAGIMGMSQYATPIDVYLDKTWQTETEEEENPLFWWGHKLEPLVIEKYHEMYPGEIIKPSPGMFISKKWSWMIGNLDGIINIDDKPGVFEIKTVGFAGDEWGRDGGNEEDIPEKYYCQVAHYLAVTGFEYAVVVALLMASRELRRYFIKRDETVIKHIVAIEERFWSEHVKPEIPPIPTNSSDCNKLWQWDKGTTITADEGIINTSIDLRNLRAEVKRLQGTDGRGGLKSELEAKIKNYMTDNLVLIDESGKKVCSWKSQDTERHDTKRFALEQPEMDAKYKKTTTSRVFRFK
jgi:putative phage-type endonuclease